MYCIHVECYCINFSSIFSVTCCWMHKCQTHESSVISYWYLITYSCKICDILIHKRQDSEQTFLNPFVFLSSLPHSLHSRHCQDLRLPGWSWEVHSGHPQTRSLWPLGQRSKASVRRASSSWVLTPTWQRASKPCEHLCGSTCWSLVVFIFLVDYICFLYSTDLLLISFC